MVKSINLYNYGYVRYFEFSKDTLIIIHDKNVSNNFVKMLKPIANI